MWIKVNNDVFNESGDLSKLVSLIGLLVYNPINSVIRYNVIVDIPKIESSTKFKALPTSFQEILKEEYNLFAISTPIIRYFISEKDKASNMFNIHEAYRFFNQPIHLIVENSNNDSQFIECLMDHFGKKVSGLRVLTEFVANGWIEFQHAGGCSNVENLIEAKLRPYNRDSLTYGRPTHEYFQGVVIIDSDKEFLTQPIKPAYEKLIRYLDSIKIGAYHILEKRMMENYMPDEVIEKLPGAILQSWINVYRILTDEQKDFLSYKDGFLNDKDNEGNRKPIHPSILALYSLSPANFEILDNGLKYPSFKTNFPELFKTDPLVNKYTLKARANSNELEDIILKIENLI